jgi:hypothetical protein
MPLIPEMSKSCIEKENPPYPSLLAHALVSVPHATNSRSTVKKKEKVHTMFGGAPN